MARKVCDKKRAMKPIRFDGLSDLKWGEQHLVGCPAHSHGAKDFFLWLEYSNPAFFSIEAEMWSNPVCKVKDAIRSPRLYQVIRPAPLIHVSPQCPSPDQELEPHLSNQGTDDIMGKIPPNKGRSD